MTSSLNWIFALNLIVNSLLSFLTSAALTALFITIFRIKNQRLKTLLLMVPIFKLALDPFMYNFEQWAIPYQLNPLEATTGSRILSILFFFPCNFSGSLLPNFDIHFSLNNGYTFTPGDLAALSITPFSQITITLFAASISLFLLFISLLHLVKSHRFIQTLTHNSYPCPLIISNTSLKKEIKKAKVQLIASPNVPVPCALGLFRKYICFPQHLLPTLTQNEFEAITAHELAHLRWYDSLVRHLCHTICCLFWWVPAKWWINRLELTQERASDQKIAKFQISNFELASAIVKTVKLANNSPLPLSITCFIHKNSLAKRLRPLLKDSQTHAKSKLRWLLFPLVGCITLSILFGKFWIF